MTLPATQPTPEEPTPEEPAVDGGRSSGHRTLNEQGVPSGIMDYLRTLTAEHLKKNSDGAPAIFVEQPNGVTVRICNTMMDHVKQTVTNAGWANLTRERQRPQNDPNFWRDKIKMQCEYKRRAKKDAQGLEVHESEPTPQAVGAPEALHV